MRTTLGSPSSAKTALGKPNPEPSPGIPGHQALESPRVEVETPTQCHTVREGASGTNSPLAKAPDSAETAAHAPTVPGCGPAVLLDGHHMGGSQGTERLSNLPAVTQQASRTGACAVSPVPWPEGWPLTQEEALQNGSEGVQEL